jgi:cytochrome c-type biogenesis protein CcmH/NrfG
VALVALLALTCAWATMQPWRSSRASDDALLALDSHDKSRFDRARELAMTARKRNPLSIEPLLDLAAIEQAAGKPGRARHAYEDAITLQPSNAETWLRYASFELYSRDNPDRAIELLDPAFFLDPYNSEAAGLLKEAAKRTGRTAQVPTFEGEPQAGSAPAPGA